jgi:hypothetical protein
VPCAPAVERASGCCRSTGNYRCLARAAADTNGYHQPNEAGHCCRLTAVEALLHAAGPADRQ